MSVSRKCAGCKQCSIINRPCCNNSHNFLVYENICWHQRTLFWSCLRAPGTPEVILTEQNVCSWQVFLIQIIILQSVLRAPHSCWWERFNSFNERQRRWTEGSGWRSHVCILRGVFSYMTTPHQSVIGQLIWLLRDANVELRSLYELRAVGFQLDFIQRKPAFWVFYAFFFYLFELRGASRYGDGLQWH